MPGNENNVSNPRARLLGRIPIAVQATPVSLIYFRSVCTPTVCEGAPNEPATIGFVGSK